MIQSEQVIANKSMKFSIYHSDVNKKIAILVLQRTPIWY